MNKLKKIKVSTKKLTTEEFIEKAKKIHGDKYDYSLVEYKGTYNKVKILCSMHGDGYDSINNVAYEYDEKHHNNRLEKDSIRQKEIEMKLGCKFIRIKEKINN